MRQEFGLLTMILLVALIVPWAGIIGYADDVPEEQGERFEGFSLQNGETVAFTSSPGDLLRFDYTPSENGIYVFELGDTYLLGTSGGLGVLLDENFRVLAQKTAQWKDERFDLSISARLKAGRKVYFCVKPSDSNAYGSLPASVTKVDGPIYAEGITVPATQTDLMGESLELNVDALTAEDANLSYTWYRKEGNQLIPISGETGERYAIPLLTQSAEFVCRISDGTVTRDVEFQEEIRTGTLSVCPKGDAKRTVSPETRVTLEALANQQSNIQYQWETRTGGVGPWTAIENASFSSYTISSVKSSGQYRCVVSNSQGETAETVFELTVDSGLWAKAENDQYTYVLGTWEPVPLKVSASTSKGEELTYQWYGVYRDGSGRYVINGATGSTYVAREPTYVTTTPAGAWPMRFICEVRDLYNNRKEVEFLVRPESNLTVRAQGSSSIQITEQNSQKDVQLAVSAASDIGPYLSYQWYKRVRRVDGSWDLWMPIFGAAESTYTVKAPLMAGDYQCEVSDGFSTGKVSFSLYSGGGGGGRQWVETPYGQPAYLRTYIWGPNGNYATDITCEWYRKKNDRWIPISNPNENSGELMTEPITEESEYMCYYRSGSDSGAYYFQVVPHGGGMTATAEQSRVTVPAGGTASLSILVTGGSANTVYQWYRGTYQEDAGKWSYEAIVGAASTRYSEACQQDTRYLCTVKDGNQTANVFIDVLTETDLTVEPIRVEGVQWTEKDGRISFPLEQGSSRVLAVQASSSKDIIYQWYCYDGAVENRYAHKLYGEIGSQLPIEGKDTTVTYECRVESGTSLRSIYFQVEATHGVELTRSEESSWRSILYGTGTELKVQAYVTNRMDMERSGYRWYDVTNRTVLEQGRLIDYNSYTLRLENLRGSRTIDFIASDGYGNEKQLRFWINATTGLALQSDSYANPAAIAGEPLKMQVQAKNQAGLPISYQWSWLMYSDNWSDGNLIPGATDAEYTAVAVRGLRFRCVVSDGIERREAYYYPEITEGNTLIIPDGVTRIEREAFEGDTSIRLVKLGANVSEVGYRAFANLGTFVLEVPNGNVVFDEDAFADSTVVMICPTGSPAYQYATDHNLTVYPYS